MSNKNLRRTAAWILGGALCLAPAPAGAAKAADGIHKQETVYGELQVDGILAGTTVSIYLSNPQEAQHIDDATNLLSLETVSGSMAPSVKNGVMRWDAKGEDVLYRGESDHPLPVSVDISYTLDGQTIAPEDMLGKSGRLKMEITFTNHDRRTLTIPAREEGEQDKTVPIYTPFTVATMMTLPQDHFTDIRSDADRTITQGSSTVIVDLAFPGLYESLGKEDKEGHTQRMTLEAQVQNFSLEEITFLVTPKLIDNTDLSELTQLDDLRESLEITDEGGQELTEGADSLKGGARTYAKAVNQYVDGVNTMAGGVKALANGLPQLAEGSRAVADGLDAIKEEADSLNLTGEGGALEQIEGLLQNSEELDLTLNALEENMGTVEDTIAGLEDSIKALEEAKKALEDSGADAGQIDTLQRQIDQLKALRDELEENKESLEAQMGPIRAALPQVKTWVGQAADGLGEITRGMEELRAGSRAVSDGLESLSDQAVDMKSGADALLKNGGKVTDGANKLARGLGSFSSALHTFNEEAIDKLAADSAGEIYDFQLRKKALIDAAEQYTSFTGLGPDMTGDVSFVLRTPLQNAQPIPAPTPMPEQQAAAPSNGWQQFWQWLTGIFGG